MLATFAWGQNACLGPLNLDLKGSDTGSPLEIQYIASDIYCIGSAEGVIQLIIQGGTPTYSCLWNTGEDAESLSNLVPGMYSVTVTDAVGCVAKLDIPVTEMTPLNNELTLAENTGCGECYLSDGQSSYFYQDDDYMVHIRDIDDDIDLNDMDICINVNDESYFLPDDKFYLKRSFAIDGGETTVGRSRIRLFFTEDELQELAIDAGVTIIDTNTLSIQKYVDPFTDQTDFVGAESIEDITFNLFDSENFVWEISFLEDNFTPGQYNQYFIQLENAEDDITSTFDPEDIADASFYLIENPVLDWVQLETENFNHVGDGSFSIVGSGGQTMYTSSFENRLVDYEKINVSDYPSGVYFFVLEYTDIELTKTFKFIKI